MNRRFGILAVSLCGALSVAGQAAQDPPAPSGAEIAGHLMASTLVIAGTPTGLGRPVNKPYSEEQKRALREIEVNRRGFLPLPETAGFLCDLKVEQALWLREEVSPDQEKDATARPQATRVRVFVARDPDLARLGWPVNALWKMDRRYIFFLEGIPVDKQGWVHSDPADKGPYYRVLDAVSLSLHSRAHTGRASATSESVTRDFQGEYMGLADGYGMIEINAVNAETVKRVTALCEALSAKELALKLGSLQRLRFTGDTVLDEAAQALIDWLKLSDTGQSVR